MSTTNDTPRWQTWAEGGLARARLTIPVPGGVKVFEAAMHPGEIADVRRTVEAMARARNAAITGDGDDVLEPSFMKTRADDDGVLEPKFGDKSKPASRVFRSAEAVEVRASAPKKKRVKVTVGPAVVEDAPLPAFDASKISRGTEVKLAVAKERQQQAGGVPWWKRAIGLRGDERPAGRGVDHCAELPDGTVVPVKIHHCPRGGAAAASSSGAEQPWTARDVDAVVGAQLREALRGRVLSQVPAALQRRASALALKARGFSVMGVTGFHREDRFVDQALRDEQELRATKAGPHAVDNYLHDAVFGEETRGAACVGQALGLEFLGRPAMAVLGVEAIEEGVFDGLKPYSRGEIVDPEEVMDPPEDRFEAETLLEQGRGTPEATVIDPSIKEPGDSLEGVSLGRAEEMEMLGERRDDVGSIFTRFGKAVGKGARGVARGIGRGASAVARTTGRGLAAAGKWTTRALFAALTAPQKAVIRALTNKLITRRARKISWDARKTLSYTAAEKAQARAWAKDYVRAHDKKFGGYIASMMGVDEEKVAIRSRQYVPARDDVKRAAVGRALAHVAGRIAGYSAWKRGRAVPTPAERAEAVLRARALVAAHGLPTTPMGWAASGALEVTEPQWNRIAARLTRSAERDEANMGFDLYYLNPLSWFRSKEVNALYLAQAEAERRKQAAMDLAPLTAETKRKMEEARNVEQAVAADVKAIMAARGATPGTALVGAWWRPRPWFGNRIAAVLRDADKIAPRRLPRLPFGAAPTSSSGADAFVGSLDAFFGGLLDAVKGLLVGAKKDAPEDPRIIVQQPDYGSAAPGGAPDDGSDADPGDDGADADPGDDT